MVWLHLGNAKISEGVIQLEEWSEEKKAQGVECYYSNSNVGYL